MSSRTDRAARSPPLHFDAVAGTILKQDASGHCLWPALLPSLYVALRGISGRFTC